MKPTQKQPEPLKNVAVTNNEIDIDPMQDGTVRCVLRGDIAKAITEKFAAYNRLLTERDEAIREVEKWRKDAISMEIRNLNQELVEEKRRTAAFREGFVGMILRNEVWSRVERGVADASKAFDDFRPEAERLADLEAQKLLADSGGEKDFKSQQKGDSK